MFPVLSKVTCAPPRYLVFARRVTLLAQQFDPVALSTEGDPLPLVRDVGRNAITMNASFSTSMNGVLAYLGARQAGTELRWFDRSGQSLGPLFRFEASVRTGLSSWDSRSIRSDRRAPCAAVFYGRV